MKCSLFLIGDSLLGNAPMLRYIERHLTSAGIRADHIHRLERGEPFCDAAMPPASELHRCFLFCDPHESALVAREIATFTHDTVIVRNDHLVPSRAHTLKTGYYRLGHRELRLHVITAYPGHKLPVPALEDSAPDTAEVQLFDADANKIETLAKQVADAYRVYYRLSEPIRGWQRCVLHSEPFGDIAGARQQLLTHFPTAVATDIIAAWLIERLEAADKTVTFAESCTGGLLSYYLTSQSGASNVFEGALVTYSNRLKASWIAVENATLEAHGAVSREVVEAMSRGAMEVAGADYAIAVSGIAGPTGGSPEKPVGTVHVAVRSKTQCDTAHLQLHGDRNYIQEQTVLHAVKMLLLIDKKTFFQFTP